MVYRTDGSDAASTMPAAGTEGPEGFPSDTTDIDPYFIAALCEELRNIVLADGQTPTKTIVFQVLQALQNGGITWGADTGSAGAYVVAPARTPAQLYPTALKAGMEVVFVTANGPNPGVCTLNYCGLGVQPLKMNSGSAFSGGEIPAGTVVTAKWNGSVWVTQNPAQLGNLGGAQILSATPINFTPQMFGQWIAYFDTGEGSVTFNLLNPALYPGKVAIVYNFSGTVGAVTTPAADIYQPRGGFSTSISIAPYQIMRITSDGINWDLENAFIYNSGTPGSYIYPDGSFEQWFMVFGTGPSAVTATLPDGYLQSIAWAFGSDHGAGGISYGVTAVGGTSKTQISVQPAATIVAGTAWSALVTVKGK